MRTTINLPDGLADEAKVRASQTGRTFTSLVEEGLRLVLAELDHIQREEPEPLPTYGDPDGQVLVDIADRDALWAALDAGREL
jgi:hypothetical protein